MREFFLEMKKYLAPFNISVIICCILVYIIGEILCLKTGYDILYERFALNWKLVLEDGEYYRTLTYMLLHGGISHLFSNIFVLFFVGGTVERALGGFKYLVNYVASGFVAGVISVYYNKWLYYHTLVDKAMVYSVGASGAIFGVVGALLWLAVANKGRIEGVSTRRMIMFILLSVYEGFANSGIDNAAHLGGLLFGVLSAVILYNKRKVIT